MIIEDVRAELPLADWQIGTFGPKLSRTYHWNGPALPTDVDPLELILGDANFHISKDWSPAPGIQGGDGIMYHKLIAPNGDLYITRNADAVLWACGSDLGNRTSEHVQVMCGAIIKDGVKVGEQLPTDEQLATIQMLEGADPLGPVHPHNWWSATSCPGDFLTQWINEEKWRNNVLTEADKAWIESLFESKLIAVEQRLNTKINAGFNETLVAVANRIVAGDKDTGTAQLDK